MNPPSWREHPVVFDCEGCRLIGIVTLPETPAAAGVIIVVGGPQYRAGSHRQFTLLARHLAGQGIASIRFDYRGMGDSEGAMRNFEEVDADIRAALDTLQQHAPKLRRIALWGLCDAASAALYYAHTDARVTSLVLLNPWVHTPAGAARARLKHYYLVRLIQPSFWSKLLSGKIKVRESTQAIMSATQATAADTPTNPRHGGPGYIARMLEGLQRFRGEILFILSGKDMTAAEFIALSAQNKQWKKSYSSPKISTTTVKGANHTFAMREWRKQVESHTAHWLNKQHPNR